MSHSRLIVGSLNKAKLREILGLLDGAPLEVSSLEAFPEARPVEETGETFQENAVQKAMGFAGQLGGLVVADDSGLVVDALAGRPGVYSARYGGAGLTDADRYRRLLDEMKDVPDDKRAARFRCAIAMADFEKAHILVSGVVEGRIARVAAGEEGFGYDPVFVPDGYDRTFAELGHDVKRKISHRARALSRFREELAEWLKGR